MREELFRFVFSEGDLSAAYGHDEGGKHNSKGLGKWVAPGSCCSSGSRGGGGGGALGRRGWRTRVAAAAPAAAIASEQRSAQQCSCTSHADHPAGCRLSSGMLGASVYKDLKSFGKAVAQPFKQLDATLGVSASMKYDKDKRCVSRPQWASTGQQGVRLCLNRHALLLQA